MRPLLILLLPWALALTATAQKPADAAPATSERTQQALRERLPKFNPAASDAARKEAAERKAAAEARRAAATAAGEEEGEVVVLPEFEVRERKMAEPHADDWLGRQELTRKAMRAKAAEMNDLEMALNRWHIPFFSASFAERARAEYEAKKRAEEKERLDHVNRVGEAAGRR